MFHVSVFCEATQQTAYFVFDKVSIDYEGAPGASILKASITAPEGYSANTPDEARQALIDARYDVDPHDEGCDCWDCTRYAERTGVRITDVDDANDVF